MEDINLERTVKTPEVHFVASKGELMIGGISIPENTVDFYHPLIYWITQYAMNPLSKTRFVVKFEYFKYKFIRCNSKYFQNAFRYQI